MSTTDIPEDLLIDWIKLCRHEHLGLNTRKWMSASLHLELNNPILSILFGLCQRLRLSYEVYLTALEFYERLLYHDEMGIYQSKKRLSVQGDITAVRTEQEEMEIDLLQRLLACIQLASKITFSHTCLTAKALNAVFPNIS